mgnify:FL=1
MYSVLELDKAEIAKPPDSSCLEVGLYTVDPTIFKQLEAWIQSSFRLQSKSSAPMRLTKAQRVYCPVVFDAFQHKKASMAANRGMKQDAAGFSDLFFHAAPVDQVHKICGLHFSGNSSGFSPKLPGKRKAPSSSDEEGIYFQPHIQFALTKGGGRGPNGEYTIVVGEVIIGNRKDVGLLSEKCEREDFDSAQFDSVAGIEPMPQPILREYGRQVIIYDRAQACPHYVLTFRLGFTIKCKANDLFLYADKDKNWDSGIGARLSVMHHWGPECEWELDPQGGGVFAIRSCVPPHRTLFAKKDHNWEAGVGAGSPPSKVHKDGLWKLVKRNGYYRFINEESARTLYIRLDSKVIVGAGWPTSLVETDGKFELEPEVPEEWMESTVAVAKPAL